MMKLDHCANCPIHSKDKIGTLAQNENDVYSNLLSTIGHLDREKNAVLDMERAKVDFLRAASPWVENTCDRTERHLGKYRNYATYLPKCKEMVEQLSGMVYVILETSKLNLTAEPPTPVDLSDLLIELCKPYQLIAMTHQIAFSLDYRSNFTLYFQSASSVRQFLIFLQMLLPVRKLEKLFLSIWIVTAL